MSKKRKTNETNEMNDTIETIETNETMSQEEFNKRFFDDNETFTVTHEKPIEGLPILAIPRSVLLKIREIEVLRGYLYFNMIAQNLYTPAHKNLHVDMKNYFKIGMSRVNKIIKKLKKYELIEIKNVESSGIPVLGIINN